MICLCNQLAQVPQPWFLHLHWLGHLPSLNSPAPFVHSHSLIECYTRLSKSSEYYVALRAIMSEKIKFPV